jgi:hypothetical protein
MTSARETALVALHQRLQTVSGPTVLRNEVLPAKVPAGGLVILRDGDPGEPEVTLKPVSYLWQHRAELEVVVEAATGEARDVALDALLVGIGETLASDPTLDGSVDWSEAGAPRRRAARHPADPAHPAARGSVPASTSSRAR